MYPLGAIVSGSANCDNCSSLGWLFLNEAKLDNLAGGIESQIETLGVFAICSFTKVGVGWDSRYDAAKISQANGRGSCIKPRANCFVGGGAGSDPAVARRSGAS